MSESARAKPAPKTFPLLLHYIKEHGLSVLYNRELKITPPGEFNDPFEFRLATPTGFTLKEIKELYLKENGFLRRFWQEIKQIPRQQYEENVRSTPFPDPNSKEGTEYYDDEFRRLRESALSWEGLDQWFGIVCFSAESAAAHLSLEEQHARVLMWGHYANGHRGMLIEFDFNRPGPPQVLAHRDGHLWEITRYEDSSPEMLLNDFADMAGAAQAKVLKRWGSVKAKPWKYEREWRLMAPRNQPEKFGTYSRLINGQLVDFISLVPLPDKPATPWAEQNPIDSVRRVVLGCKASQSFEDDVRQVLDAPAYRHVHLQKVELLPREYGLAYKTIREPEPH